MSQDPPVTLNDFLLQHNKKQTELVEKFNTNVKPFIQNWDKWTSMSQSYFNFLSKLRSEKVLETADDRQQLKTEIEREFKDIKPVINGMFDNHESIIKSIDDLISFHTNDLSILQNTLQSKYKEVVQQSSDLKDVLKPVSDDNVDMSERRVKEFNEKINVENFISNGNEVDTIFSKEVNPFLEEIKDIKKQYEESKYKHEKLLNSFSVSHTKNIFDKSITSDKVLKNDFLTFTKKDQERFGLMTTMCELSRDYCQITIKGDSRLFNLINQWFSSIIRKIEQMGLVRVHPNKSLVPTESVSFTTANKQVQFEPFPQESSSTSSSSLEPVDESDPKSSNMD